MDNFEGFYPETTDILMGIRMNNNKEWFAENKDKYKEYVHEPMVVLSKALFDGMKKHDGNFNANPKVSRVNRDIRFSKEKLPYKECKWVMFRADNCGSMEHESPTYFFEISPDWYRFGFGYWPGPKGMLRFRKKIDANLSQAESVIQLFNGLDYFKLDGETYKRNISAGKPQTVADWYQCKHLNFIYYGNNDNLLYKEDLLDFVLDGYKKLYPVYQYFENI